jgi:LysM repeat protein
MPTLKSYTVQDGDTLLSIAQSQLGDSSQAAYVAAANRMESTPLDLVLPTGTVLTVPPTADASWSLPEITVTPKAFNWPLILLAVAGAALAYLYFKKKRR